MQVFLDEVSCGGSVEIGGGDDDGKEESEGEWVKVGGSVVVGDVSAGGVGHTIAVTVQGYGGWNATVDDGGVVVGC